MTCPGTFVNKSFFVRSILSPGTLISDPTTAGTPSADSYAVIGAGPSGLTVLKNLRAAGIAVQGYEAQRELGGVWNLDSPAGRVYETTHLISSKRRTEFPDFPMPDEYPAYPSHTQVLAYLRAYAEHYELLDSIRFQSPIARIEPCGAQWLVRTVDGRSNYHRGVIIANGHHQSPLLPELPGHFTGEVLHSSQYKSPQQLVGKRVLILGAGNSGCDLAVDAALHARTAVISMRRGYHFTPKFIRGAPTDEWGEMLLRWRIPLFIRRALLRFISRLALGSAKHLGLPIPDHRFFESHPLINSQLIYHLGHGKIIVKPAVKQFEGATVTFADDSVSDFDLLLLATGYRTEFPFIDPGHLNVHDGLPRLYLHFLVPHHDRLFVAGMIQPDSGQWGLTDLQAQIIAAAIRTEDHPTAADWLRKLKQTDSGDLGNGIRYLQTPRHALEVEHFGYRRRLEKLLQQLNKIRQFSTD